MNQQQLDESKHRMHTVSKRKLFLKRAYQSRVDTFGEMILIGVIALLTSSLVTSGADYLVGGSFTSLVAACSLRAPFGRAFLLVGSLLLTVFGALHFLFSILLSSPIRLGVQKVSLGILDGEDASVRTLFAYFRGGYLKAVRLNLLYSVVVMLPSVAFSAALYPLWANRHAFAFMTKQSETMGTYVLIVAGIAAAMAVTVFLTCFLIYTYRFAFTVMAEHPHMTAIEAMRVSRTMMSGHRRRLFLLDLSFWGWSLLLPVTLGVGYIFFYVYREVALAAFYDDLTNRSSAKEVMFPSLNFDDYVTEDEEEKTEAKPTPVREKTPDVPADEQGGGGMPFTSELYFPSLDPADYAGDDDDGLFHRKRVKRDKNENN